MSSSSNSSVSEDANGVRALPSFAPVRRNFPGESEEKPGSSASGSRRSTHSSVHDESPAAQKPRKNRNASPEDNGLTGASGTVRRSHPRSSGGFLLDTALHPRRAFLSRSKKAANSEERRQNGDKLDFKGKRPREESEIVLPKRRARDFGHEKSSSIGGSPLSTEIKQDTDTEDIQGKDNLIAGRDVQNSTFLQGESRVNLQLGSTQERSRAPPSVGFDTDPAQIVNMALILNEKRRRQVSGGRMVSGQSPSARTMSGTISPQVGLGGQFSTPMRASPRLSSHPSDHSGTRRTSGPIEQQRTFVTPPATFDEEPDEMDTSFTISQATERRVQKARTYFELAYEHRRLLSHLPPIRRPGVSLRDGQSKVYNPLQYSRNRKLRFSEKHPIAAEAEGWHDIDQVRAWVSTVIEAHSDARHDPDECVRLPDLAYYKAPGPDEEDEEDQDPLLFDSPASSLRKLSAQKNAKPRRPRSDWVTHPGDMVADANWLEQGQNKLKIVDRAGNKIYPSDTRFKFSGWRNRPPVDVPERLQEPTRLPEQDEDDVEEKLSTPPPSALPELPTFTSAHNGRLKLRHRRNNGFKSKFRSQHKDTVLDGGASDSSSSDEVSDEEGSTRGRKLISRKRQKSEDGPVETGLKFKSIAENQLSRNYGSSAEHSFDQSANSSKRPSVDHSRLSKLFTRDSRTDSSKNPSKTRSDSGRRESTNGPSSRGSYDGDNIPRSSAEYDTTAPTSPTSMAFPSIAINLSPPASRSPSPSKKTLPSILNPFRDRSQSKVPEGTEANDFGQTAFRQHTRRSGNEADPGHESSDHASRGTSPMTRGTSPMTKPASKAPAYHEQQGATDEHRDSTVSKVSTKSANIDGHSKVRGIFKGGRIAELVGNEVSKVGDFIWKRDVPSPIQRRDSTSSSIDSYHASDTDDEPFQNGFAYKTPPQHEKRFPSNETEAERANRLSPSDSRSSPDSGEKIDPRYHNPNLPSFTSPFEKDRDTQDEKKRNGSMPIQSSEEARAQPDHISHLAAQHRTATKSPRLDRLAPPKLDLSRSASPHAAFTMSGFDRHPSYGFGEGGRDFSKSRNASQIFNNALSLNGNTMVTGLTGINPTKSRSRSRIDLFRTTSHQSASSAALEVMDVSRRDIAFTYALLITSAVKAREIALRAETIRDPVPAFLLNTIEPDNSTLHSSEPLQVKRKEEHIVAARNLITRLEKDGQRFQVKLQSFQSTLLPNLHCALQGLEDLVDNDLTPRVRKSGDEAGELGVKLSETSTLAVKNVNERIDAALRRRRRGPVRALRRFGYLCIEWVVVALLWGIWAVVTAIRVVRAVIVFFVRSIRWLLFL